MSEPLAAHFEIGVGQDNGVLRPGTLLGTELWVAHETDESRHSSPMIRHRKANEQFLAQTRHNALAYASGGAMAQCLERLGLRCMPMVASSAMVEGPVHRITRSHDFVTPFLHARLRQLAEARAHRGLGGRITFTMVRHAQTTHNSSRLLTGAWFGADVGITDEGLETLRELEIPANAVILHSPLTRAHDTATALAQLHGAAAQLAIDGGHEMCLGPFEGQQLDHLIRCDASFQRLFLHGDALGAHPSSECLADLLVRVGFLVDEIVDLVEPCDLEELHLVFVGHTMVNRALHILADEMFDDARGHYVCDGIDEEFPLMKNATAMTIFEG